MTKEIDEAINTASDKAVILNGTAYAGFSAAAFRRALAEAGYAVVPREPTQEMLRAGGSYVADMVGDPYNAWQHFTGEATRVYRAMIRAAEG